MKALERSESLKGEKVEQIKQLLLEEGLTISDEEIRGLLGELGIDNPSETEARELANELRAKAQPVQGGLTVSNGKAKTPARRNNKRRKETPSLTNALTHTASVAQAELASVSEVVKAGAEAWATDQADQMVAAVRNAPKEALEKFAAMAMEESADINSFRKVGEEISAILFSVQSSVEAE